MIRNNVCAIPYTINPNGGYQTCFTIDEDLFYYFEKNPNFPAKGSMECALNGKPQSAEQAGSEPAESAAEQQAAE